MIFDSSFAPPGDSGMGSELGMEMSGDEGMDYLDEE